MGMVVLVDALLKLDGLAQEDLEPLQILVKKSAETAIILTQLALGLSVTSAMMETS